MQKPKKEIYSLTEYYELEEREEYKSEYYKGEIFAMAGGSRNHSRMQVNLFRNLSLPKDCEVYSSDLKVWIEQAQHATYPDASIVCGEVEFYNDRTDTITNPIVIFEILSKSTEAYDRGKKFDSYRLLPSLREYVLINQNEMHVEHFYKSEKGQWVFRDYRDEESLNLLSIDSKVAIADFYQNVNFEEKE